MQIALLLWSGNNPEQAGRHLRERSAAARRSAALQATTVSRNSDLCVSRVETNFLKSSSLKERRKETSRCFSLWYGTVAKTFCQSASVITSCCARLSRITSTALALGEIGFQSIGALVCGSDARDHNSESAPAIPMHLPEASILRFGRIASASVSRQAMLRIGLVACRMAL